MKSKKIMLSVLGLSTLSLFPIINVSCSSNKTNSENNSSQDSTIDGHLSKINLSSLNVGYSKTCFDYITNLSPIMVSIDNINNKLMSLMTGENKRFNVIATKDGNIISNEIYYENNSIYFYVPLSISSYGKYGFKFIDLKINDSSHPSFSTQTISALENITIGTKLINLDLLDLEFSSNGVLNQVDNNESNLITLSLTNIPNDIKENLLDFYTIEWYVKSSNNLSFIDNSKNKTSISINQKGTYLCKIQRINSNLESKTFEVNIYDLLEYSSVNLNISVKNLNTCIGNSIDDTYNEITILPNIISSTKDSNELDSGYKLKIGSLELNLNVDNKINMNQIDSNYVELYKNINGNDYLIKKIEILNWNDYKESLVINKINETNITNELSSNDIPLFLKDLNYKYVLIYGNFNKINDSLFLGWTNLQNVLIESSNLLSIGNSTFKNCNNLISALFIGQKTISISDSAFENAYKLMTLNFKYRTMGSEVETHSWNPDKINLDVASILTIGNSSFKNTFKLWKLEFGSELSKLGEHCFDSSGLINVDLSKALNLKSIPSYAFKNCQQLETFIYCGNEKENQQSGITSIGNNAFDACIKLCKFYPSYYNESSAKNNFIYLSNSINSIGNEAFALNMQITEITNFPDSITILPTGIFRETGITRIDSIIKNVTTIGNSSFYWIDNVDRFSSPSIQRIEKNAMYNTSFNLVELNENITFIGSNAFASSIPNVLIKNLTINFSSIKSDTKVPKIFENTLIESINFGDDVLTFYDNTNDNDTTNNEVYLTLHEFLESINDKTINVFIASNATELETQLTLSGFINIIKRP